MKKQSLLKVTVLSLLNFALFSCSPQAEKADTNEDLSKGETLAKNYCAGCHSYVNPELLPKAYWNSVLSKMSMHFGVNDGSTPNQLNTKEALVRLDSAGVFPKNPTLTKEEWKAIKDFILKKAQETIPQGPRPPINFELARFKLKPVSLDNNQQIPSLVKVLGKNRIGLGLSSSAENHSYSITDLDGKSKATIALPSPVTALLQYGAKLYLTLMGPFAADDNPQGKIISIATQDGLQINNSLEILLNNRERPIHTNIADFDKDGKNDLLVTEFGKYLGGLNLYLQNSHKGYTKKTLYNGPGAISTIIKDVNHDGLPDIYALISQEKEGINLYINKGHGDFEEKVLLTFPPYYGSTHFEVIDFDQDGKDDIIYSNGDSGDFGMPAKPFHGIRFYKNYADFSFKEEWFYPQQGTYKAIVKDFDQDGDLDIASIGFFAIATLPDESFLYLENQGNIKGKHNFKTYSFSEARNNSYMVMDAGDIDNDGDIDLVLGSSMTLLTNSEKKRQFEKWKKEGGMIMILENTLK
ncbi:FG-GAP-like repeat-containing protein [uncultured Arcticibacterium sp.]|uniref:FG-GAP-like repeat-containing protein n=1 Tax=uncultured Arcticibacterium sp. TaxID=2173042 RepID=UPI0030F64317